MKGLKTIKKRVLSAILAAALVMTGVSVPGAKMEARAESTGTLVSADSVTATAKENVVMVNFNGGSVQGKITFLENGIFRYNVDPTGTFSEYASINNASDLAKIPQYPDDYKEYSHPKISFTEEDGYLVISAEDTKIKFEKATAKMTVEFKGEVVMEESTSLSIVGNKTTQSLVKNDKENFFGGGTQNGRFIHTGESINIKNESNWVDGGVASPNPFYFASGGYGILRNTFLPGVYDFGKTTEGIVTTVHNESEYDAYIFLSDGGANTAEVTQDVLQGYYHVTGNPVLLPEYGYYEGHLNCYNRDSWSDDNNDATGWVIKGSSSGTKEDSEPIASAYSEAGQRSGYVFESGMGVETLNGTQPGTEKDNFPTVTTNYEYSARAVIDQYVAYDMPLGYFLPNDGYGCGYGQNGYYKTGGVDAQGKSSDARIAAVDANVEGLKEFTAYAKTKGVATGLWTQSNLEPSTDGSMPWHLLRDFEKEVNVGGISALKTDVAWVGHGYNFAINSIKSAYDIVTEAKKRPNIITLDGWAGTHRYSCVWTGDQYGGNWEYIRFHIPTYIGQSLSGNPNVASDMDGIFGGDKIISTRDTQWKIFSPQMLNMDGWGKFAKTPQTFGDPYTGIHRMYLKLKAQLLPYLYTTGASAANIDTGNNDTGLPMVRAMFLEYPEDDYAETKDMQYQYMFGSDFLVAPIYQDTAMEDNGDDIRNDIYLPGTDQIWIDYFTGKQYKGGQVLNGFEAPLWKLPVFVKNGAIIPMWEENNSPMFINKANRIVEFWPAGNTEYTLYEDDGSSLTANFDEVEGYGKVNMLDYGAHVLTKFTSKVEDTTATLTAEKAVATGNYEGYSKDKNTTFIVNVSKEPDNVIATNGTTNLEKVVVESKAAFDEATAETGKFVYYYDASPAIETYSSEAEDEFIAMMANEKSSPKLYVKFATTDSQVNEQKLVIQGFENKDSSLGKDVLNTNLQAPTGLADKEDAKTPDSNTITWTAVADATSYEVLVDGIIHSAGADTEFVHDGQKYNSEHTYQVRARNAEGYSEWSAEIKATTSLDPWRNVPEIKKITWSGGEQWGAMERIYDHVLDGSSSFHSSDGINVVTDELPMILDYGLAYKLDKMEYYPREDLGNGTVSKMDVFTSLDGVTWTQVHDGNQTPWSYTSGKTATENVKTISLTGVTARYVKMVVKQSVGNFFAANEIAVYKVDESKGFAVGSTLGNASVLEGDFYNMNSYLGINKKDLSWSQVSSGDINGNEYYDVYDYAFTMFNLDGGTQKTGKVSGDIYFIPSKTEVSEGETFTVDVYADNVANLNAFGHVIGYNKEKVEFVSVAQSLVTVGQMQDLSKNRAYEDESYLSLAFANRGNQETFSGSGILATITMKALSAAKVTDALDLDTITMMGPGFDFKEGNSLVTITTPELNLGNSGKYAYGTDFTMSMTNDLLTADQGENVNKFIETNSYEKLFDGKINREDFQFKWDVPSNYPKVYPDNITLPTTLNFIITGNKTVTEVKVHNANVGNGYATKAEAVFKYEDGTQSEVISRELVERVDFGIFSFVNPKADSKVTSVEVTITEAVDSNGQPVTHMLTLSEIEVLGTELPTTEEGDSTSNNSTEAGSISDNTLEGEAVSTKLTYEVDFLVKMTNEKMIEDTGNHVAIMTQQGTYAKLFDGNFGSSSYRDFEFKYDIPDNYVDGTKLPDYITLPVTLHVNMAQAKKVSEVALYNGTAGNGYVTEATAKFNYQDGTAAEEVSIAQRTTDDNSVLTFTNVKPENVVSSVEITITGVKDDATNVLSIAELAVTYPTTIVPVTAIAIAEEQAKELYKGEMADVKVLLTPEDATNPYYTVSSNDISKVRIVTLTNAQGDTVYKLYGQESGTATITVTALEGADGENPITATFEVTVLQGANKTKLIEAIQKYSSLNRKFYTEETLANLDSKIEAANQVKDDVAADEMAVKTALDDLNLAFNQLQESEVTLIADITGFQVEAAFSDSNLPEKVLDYQESTFWESPYGGSNFFLPKDLVFTLDGTYNLDKIEVVKNNAANGKLLKFEVLVSTDGEEYYSVGTKDTPATETNPYIRMDVQGVTHVIVRLLEACEGDKQVQYVRVSDVKFYGAKQGEGPGTGSDTDSDIYGDIIEEDRVDLPSIPGNIWVKGITEKPYTGGKVTQNFRVYDGNVMLKEGVDYTVSYKNNVNASTGASATFDKNKPTVTIKMKGNYKGSQSINFNIIPQSLSADSVTADAVTIKVGAKEPTPVVYWNGKALKVKKDFTVTYNYGEGDTKGSAGQAGTYTITITGINNFTDTKNVNYVVSSESVSLAKATVTIAKEFKNIPWNKDGAVIPEGKLTVKANGKELTSGTDYEVKYANNKTVGTAYVIVEGKGAYSGSKRVSFKVTGTAMKNVTVEWSNGDKFPYEGKAIAPIGTESIKVKLGDKELVAGTDFTVTYKNNAKQGKATMTLTGKADAGFTGTKSVPFTITKGQLDASMLKLVGTTEVTAETQEITVPFTQGGTKPVVKVMANGKELVLGTDYTVAYSNNKKVNQTATIKITGKGNYAGTITEEFKIVPKNVEEYPQEVSVVVADKVVSTAKKDGWKSTVKVVDISGKTIAVKKENVKYVVVSSPDASLVTNEPIVSTAKVPAGSKIKVEVDITGENYVGTVSGTYRILAKDYDISKATIKIAGKDYTGKPVTLTNEDITIKIKKNTETPVLNEDYIIVGYTNNVKKGTAKVTLQGVGDFGGTKTVTFKIGQRDLGLNLFEDFFNWIFG